MASAHPILTTGRIGAVLGLGGALLLCGCANLPNEKMFVLGGVDPNSAVAAEVVAATQSPGPYPKLSRIPSAPTDVRTTAAWKLAVTSEWAAKTQLEASAAAVPFTLNNTEDYAAATRARISPEMAVQAPADAAAQAEAFADAERARATPPPKPN
jgi:hypothetical protein